MDAEKRPEAQLVGACGHQVGRGVAVRHVVDHIEPGRPATPSHASVAAASFGGGTAAAAAAAAWCNENTIGSLQRARHVPRHPLGRECRKAAQRGGRAAILAAAFFGARPQGLGRRKSGVRGAATERCHFVDVVLEGLQEEEGGVPGAHFEDTPRLSEAH